VLIEVRRPYVDVSAHDLSLTFGAPAQPAIEVLRLRAGGYAIELRLLGFSHQALVEGGAELSETVACVPGVSGTLPARRSDGRYDFRARVEQHPDAGAYAARASAILANVADDRCALAGVFAAAPGAAAAPLAAAPLAAAAPVAAAAPLAAAAGLPRVASPAPPSTPAFTALAARPLPSGAGIAWTTWHGYPQTGEIVVTSSRLERPQ